MLTKDFICLICPNGCHLLATVLPDDAVQITGNRCDKGLAFAQRVLESDKALPVRRLIFGQERISYSQATLADIAGFWGIALASTHPGVIPDGSPERTLFRLVIADEKNNRFVLEQIPPRSYHTKMKIIKTLEFLHGQGLSRITPYVVNPEGHYIQERSEGFWQLVPFVRGVALDREQYLYEGWRAKVLSRFLLDFQRAAAAIPFLALEKPFSLRTYVYTLLRQVEARQPRVMGRISAVMDLLEKDFFPKYDQMPLRFCHGDYHPLNIIWGQDNIKAVIDWEFCGIKPEIYDLANMVGCLGMEHPSSLTDELVTGLIQELKGAGFAAAQSWDILLEFIVAQRFAWLSEWLRKDDQEMVQLELDYLELLIENRDKLRVAWGI